VELLARWRARRLPPTESLRKEDPVIHRSPLADVVPPDQTLTEYVLAGAEGRADKNAIVDGPSGRALTYGALAAMVRRAAKGLSLRGFGKGDVFALYCPNVPEYAVAFHGVASLGGINTTINPLYTPEELKRQLNDAGAKLLLTVPPFLESVQEGVRDTGVEEVFVLGEGEDATPFAALLENDGDPPHVDIDPATDLVVLPYSSGTTGFPKGVMLTHRNLVANLEQTMAALGGLHESDVTMGVLPFFHIYGMVVVMSLALRVGSTVVSMPRFDLPQFLGLVQEHRATGAYLVPPIVLALAKHPVVDDYDLSSLRWILSGAAPLGKDIATATSDRLGCLVLQGYGLTETSPVSHVNPLDAERIKPGSVGPPAPSTQCRIVDVSSGEDLGPGENGEIWIRGPQVMHGYLNEPDATKACLDEEGWFHTGDIGYADEDGYFFIVDRLKELIKYKGMQVAPAELEALLLTHPKIADVAVVPKPDEAAGEIPKAFVVRREDLSEEAVKKFVAGRVAPHKKIRAVEFVDRIPKSPSGKILRRVLIDFERQT
jgi:acyl-CoA synthetase (AMP-forming)/AMP-acid ligase II